MSHVGDNELIESKNDTLFEFLGISKNEKYVTSSKDIHEDEGFQKTVINAFKNPSYEKEFFRDYTGHGSKYFYWKVVLVLGIAVHVVFLSIDYFNRFIFKSWTFFLVTVILRYVVAISFSVGLLLFHVDIIIMRNIIVPDSLMLLLCILFLVGQLSLDIFTLPRNEFGVGIHGSLATTYAILVISKIRVIHSILITVFGIVAEMILLPVVHLDYGVRLIPRFVIFIVVCLLGIFQNYIGNSQFRSIFRKERELKKMNEVLESEEERGGKLLSNIFPKIFLKQILKQDIRESFTSEFRTRKHEREQDHERFYLQYDDLTLILGDLVEFSEFCHTVSAKKLISILNVLFGLWDSTAVDFGIEKISSIGDSILVADINHSGIVDCVTYAITILSKLKDLNSKHGWNFRMRVGIAIGRGTIGFIGKGFNIECMGDVVNDVRLCESKGSPGHIVVNQRVQQNLDLRGLFRFFENEKCPNTFVLSVYSKNKKFRENRLRESTGSSILRRVNTEFNILRKHRREDDSKSEISTENSDTLNETSSDGLGIENPMKIRWLPLIFTEKKLNWKFLQFLYSNQVRVAKINHLFISLILLIFSVTFIIYQYDLYSNYALIVYFSITTVNVILSLGYFIPIVHKYLVVGYIFSVIEIVLFSTFMFFLFSFDVVFIQKLKVEELVPVFMIITFFQLPLPFVILKFAIVLIVLVAYSIVFIIFFGFEIDALGVWALLLALQTLSSYSFHYSILKSFRAKFKVKSRIKEVKKRYKKNNVILNSTIPSFVVTRIRELDLRYDQSSDGVIMFAKICLGSGFYKQLDGSKTESSMGEMMNLMNQLFFAFDKVIEKSECLKIKSVFETYLLIHKSDLKKMVKCGFDLITESKKLFNNNTEVGGIKIGIARGNIVCGVVGLTKIMYDCFGKIVNECHRICCASELNMILSSVSKEYLEMNDMMISEKKEIQAKGFGRIGVHYVLGICREIIQ